MKKERALIQPSNLHKMTQKIKPKTTQTSPDGACVGVTIQPGQHPITNDMIDKDALFVLKTLQKAGYCGYLVGGGVRDLYLGKTPKDFDISTDARPGQLRKLFPRSNTIGRRFRLVQVFFRGGNIIEVSTLRSFSEYDIDGPEAVLAPNNTFGTLHEDARRRDLTINSLFYEIQNQTIIDYVKGSEDLNSSIIRIVGDPEKRLTRDPVRMLRAIRHAARNNFIIEDLSWSAICKNAPKLTLCPPSRLRDELIKDLYSEASAPWFTLALDSGLFYALFPVYKNMLNPETEAGQKQRELLKNLFSTIDNLNALCKTNQIHRQKDFFLFALLLTPVVEETLQLYTIFRKGAALFHLGKQIRRNLDQGIGIQLNLRKSLRQEVVSLLINLAQLIHHRQQDDWPKWLKKKSYFKRTELFYQCYLAATTNTPIELSHISNKLPLPPATEPSTSSPQTTEPFQHTPVILKNHKGGIFGFKR
ncbi:MAG: polya polymerase [Desulfotalea sp.]|nr:MAG: polya polymerase [Desulfotalea sp.]